MKSGDDLVRGWFRKAESDLKMAEASISLKVSFDAGCFHAQQVIEKYLKGYLIYNDVEFPFVHDLGKLLELCSGVDASFGTLLDNVRGITEYAVQLRYDPDFWPPLERLKSAYEAALKIKQFVLSKLPSDVQPTRKQQGSV